MAYTTIKKPSDYFNTKLYTGNSTTLSVTGVGFQPDWTWIKDRTSAGDDHALYDVVRGATKRIRSNQTDAENTQSTGLTSFDSDGFTVGTNGASNGNGDTFVSWNWLASNTTASNTDGSITTTVSANTTSGFSIIKYTGTGVNATVGHGLGVAPKVVIYKKLTVAEYWYVYTDASGWNQRLHLNGTQAKATSTTLQSTSPTSSVVSISTDGSVNQSGQEYIMYCFAEKQGFSKFGSYTGNGNADGTFVYTGFKPAFVICKRTNLTGQWNISDNKRNGFNPQTPPLYAESSEVENSAFYPFDFYSNGFKARQTSSSINGSGDTYIYMAFAEEPLVGDNPATAR